MIEIQLTQGQVAFVDDEDSDLAKIKWNAYFNPRYADGGRFIARRSITLAPGEQTVEYLHRVVLARKLNRPLLPTELVDHIYGDTLDNRRSQIRLATHSQNAINRYMRSDNTSGFKGVSWDKKQNKWRAQIMKFGKRHTLGRRDTAEEAYSLYCDAAIELYGEFARFE